MSQFVNTSVLSVRSVLPGTFNLLVDTLILSNIKKSDCFIALIFNIYNSLLSNADSLSHLKEQYDKSGYKITIGDIVSRLELLKDKDAKVFVKEYNALHKQDNEILDLVSKEIKSNENEPKILNLFAGLGIIRDIINSTIQFEKLDCYDQDEKLVKLGALTSPNEKISIKQTDILHSNDIAGPYDMVVADIPENIKNIVYAKLCGKIKELKIRGTKSEPLIVQLVYQLVGSGGKVVLIVPNSFLFGDSKQHIDTRQFIYENSSHIKIINLSSKKSIFVATKSSNLLSKCNFIIQNHLDKSEIIPSKEQIESTGYSFYLSSYVYEISTQVQTQLNDTLVLDNIINIYGPEHNLVLEEPIVYSFSNINFSIGTKPSKFDYLFVSKDPNLYLQDFINYFLMHLFEKNIDLITKGKTKILCVEKIKNMRIDQYSLEYQNNIINIIKANQQIEELLLKQNENIDQLIKIKMKALNSQTVKLGTIVSISNITDGEKTISINKNSSMAGHVFITSEPTKSDNIYFLTIRDNNYTTEFLHIYLKSIQNRIIELSQLNNSVSLPRKNLEMIDIPVISIDKQKEICEEINKYNQLVDQIHIKSQKEIANLSFSSH
jgi:hypothetical protein